MIQILKMASPIPKHPASDPYSLCSPYRLPPETKGRTMSVESIAAPAPEVTATQTRLWEDYQAAVAAHNIACASSSFKSEDRVRLALESTLAWRAFSESCGVVLPSAAAEQRIKALLSQVDALHSSMFEAYSCLFAVHHGDMISHVPANEAHHDAFNAACSLIRVALDRLSGTLKSDGVM